MKKQTSNDSSSLENHLQQFTDDHPMMQWIEKNGKTLLIALLGLIAALFIIYRMSSNSNAKADADYNDAAQQYAIYQKSDDKEALDKLQAILARRPELHPKYDGLIAQLLINRSQPQLAEPYANSIFKRVSTDHVPHYEEFAAITLVISKGDFESALQQSKELKQKLLKDATTSQQTRSFGDMLFAYNLLRIAMLEQKVGTPEGERAAWSEWKSYANASTNSASIKAASFYTLDSLFGEGSLSLNNYIKTRE